MPTTVSPPPPLPVHRTTTTPSIAEAVQHVGGINIGQVVMVIVGILVMVAVVSIIAIAILRRRSGRTRYLAVGMLEKAIESGDAVGIILDLDTHKMNIVPLRRIQGYYASLEPKYPVIVTVNPYTQMFMVHGKPVVHAVGSGRSALQVDPVVFTRLGLAQVALKDPLWRSTTEPRKAFELLVERIMSNMGRQTGELQLAHDMKLAFEMAPPDILISLLQQYIIMNEMVINSTVNFSETAEQLSKILKEHQLREMEVKQKWLFYGILGVTVLSLVAAIAWYIMHLGGR